MSYTFEEFYIPDRMRLALERYVEYGTVGEDSFMWYLLINDFKGMCAHADHENLRNLPAYAVYLCNEMPAVSQGSAEKVVNWVNMHITKLDPEKLASIFTSGEQNETRT